MAALPTNGRNVAEREAVSACMGSIVKAPGVMPDGKIGARGFRAHCRACGYMGTVRAYWGAHYDATKHTRKARAA